MRSVLLVAAAALAVGWPVALGQAALSMPSWLAPYPGAAAQSDGSPALLQSTYRIEAKPDDVVEHYRKLFEAAGTPFRANFDGVGTTIRGAAAECDLLITVREESAGAYVRVNCSSKAPPPKEMGAPGQIITSNGSVSGVRSYGSSRAAAARPSRPMPSPMSRPPSMPSHEATAAEASERHKRLVAELGIHPVYQDTPPPPLVWPSWLVHLRGPKLQIQQAVDQSKDTYLKARFVTSVPMSEIYTFYEDLLNANGHRVHTSQLSTGQTLSGVTQNHYGYVEGTNHPNGSPGPRTVIHVGFTRSKLNDPITVDIKFTPYAFKAPKRAF